MIVRPIFFSILFFSLYSVFSQPGCKTTYAGNYLTIMNSDFDFILESKYDLADSTNFMLYLLKLPDNQDTIPIALNASIGKINMCIMNNGVLTKSIPSRFYISNLPNIPGEYNIYLSRKHKENFLGMCVYNITPKHWDDLKIKKKK